MTSLTVRQTLTLIVLFVASSSFFIVLDNANVLDPVKTGLLDVVQPISRGLREVADGPTNNSDLAQQLRNAEAERDSLQATVVAQDILLAETEQIRAQVEFQNTNPDWVLVTAQVVNRDPSGNQKLIVVDKGSADGIREGMAVVDPNAYVGIVTKVEENSSVITLAIDESHQVGAQLVDGGEGVAYGMWQQGGRMELRHVDRDLEPVEGDYVVTADAQSDARTSQVPPNLPIGRVIGVPERDLVNDTLIIEIYPYSRFEELKVVSIIVVADE